MGSWIVDRLGRRHVLLGTRCPGPTVGWMCSEGLAVLCVPALLARSCVFAYGCFYTATNSTWLKALGTAAADIWAVTCTCSLA
jgi:hypothetical protein